MPNKYKHLNEKAVDKEDFVLVESHSTKAEDFLLKENFLEKQKSLIHKFGIFTTIQIPANQPFYLISPKNIFSTHIPKSIRIATGKFVFDEKIINYVNHSCNPNSEIGIEQKRVVLRAKRLIETGEEITIDYCENEEKNNLIQCKCKSEKCRNFFFTT
ncbi:MAG: SET domain-containing protein-lysine N-methyltransferase [Candidatus ainarchaeum sp.]|nr:SET domain-containing protein-lysine N-methyltransferase [Candidatus ainarchaeum sp.]